ncbi:transglutaminase domain-containing protein [Nocardioides daeguensis]|uniref:Transglutaminase-like domain-containing protein n=1 Tax=Nocardioides daeguensis TaxID=908359 RepID=A0ABP6UX47_9ACTN|nr:transglutaminase domain-containing protein [Nocardioides daeguensis]MBV6725921.1 transglutaminase domain-containing protein [Nocardioides daeguensis]MCR1772564.1 transglutaminase domain-containing protein [Nocardioides daeguensis]
MTSPPTNPVGGVPLAPPVRSASRSGPVLIVPDRRRGRGALPPWWLVLTDAALVIGLGVLGAWPLGQAWTGHRWLIAVVVGLALGVAIAWAGARWRLGPWLTALLTAAAYLAVGSAVAVPNRTSGGVVPTADSLHDLVVGLVQSWRESLTLPVPLGETGVVLLVPFLTGLLGGLAAAVLLWRSRWPGLAGVVLALVLVVSSAFGDVTAQAALARGLVIAVVALVWLRWRSLRHVRARWGRRVLATLVVVGVAGGAASGLGALADPEANRVVLRDHVDPPFDPHDYPSPLAKFRAYKKEPLRTETSLFAVDGLDSGTRVRLAVMDTYDGIVWNVSGGPEAAHDSGTFRRLRNDPEANAKATTRGAVTVTGYTGVWVPSVGDTLAMTPVKDGRTDDEAAAELVVNRETGTVAQIGGVEPGTTFEVEALAPPVPVEEDIATREADSSVSLPAPAVVPEELVDRVQRWQAEDGFGGGTGGELAQFLRDSFREHGFYSDGIDDDVPAGHGAARLAELTKTPNPVGNAEQYAAAMALIGQRLGLPIRVVLGFKVPPGGDDVRGEDISAWTEVKLRDVGWVPFDPTPPEDQKLRKPNDDPDEDPQPQVLQPPRVPGEPKEASDNLQQGDGQRRELDVLAVLGTILGIALDVAKVALLLSPLWGVLLFKFWRRRRRRRADDPTLRLTGAWHELADRMRDLGVRPPPGATRRESAYAAADRYEAVPVVTLAHTADRHVYGEGEPTPEEVGAYWADVDTAVRRMRRATPWWRRLLARFSLASVPWRAGVERLRSAVGRRGRGAGRWFAALGPVVRGRAVVRRAVRATTRVVRR